MKLNIKHLALCFAILLNCQVFSQALGYDNHRIAISADGNNQADDHPEAQWPKADPDDWSGTPAALAMLAKAGLQDKLVHYSYNNFIGAPAHTSSINYMADAVNGAIQRWGFDSTRFFDVPVNPSTAITHLVNEIKKSTENNPLFFIHMGPSEFFYQAVEQVVNDGDLDPLSHVQVISHSGYNDNHLRRTAHHTMAQTITLSGDRIKYKKIQDQNGCDNVAVKWCSGTDFSPYYWIRDHDREDIKWLYSRLIFHPSNKADMSDAGMVWYLLLDDEFGNPNKFENFVGEGVAPEVITTPCQDFSFNGVQDFEMSQIDPYVISYKDVGRNAIAVDAVQYKDQFGATQKVFDGPTGNYDITITSLTEEDGESTYRLRISGELVGSFQNPVAITDMAPFTHTFTDVAIKKGDVFQIESNTHSNGTIPEGDGFAWARGRWRSVDFQCVEVTANDPEEEDCDPEEVDGLLVFEAERFNLQGAWKIGNDAAKASSGKYIYYDGPNSYQNVNSANNISYTFKINNPGTYTFKWTMRQPPEEQGSDLGNDAWFYFSNDIARGNGGVVLKQFYKYVGRSDDDFTLNGAAEISHESHGVSVVFPEAGDYTLNLSGRSHGFQLDRIILFKDRNLADLPSEIALIQETNTCEEEEENPTGEEVALVNPFTTFEDSLLEMPLTVSYIAVETRSIVVDLAELNGNVISSSIVEVDAGTGEVPVTISLSTPLQWGKTFKIVTSMKSVTDDTTIRKVQNGFSIDANQDLNVSTFVEYPTIINSTRNVIKVRYETDKNRDIVIQLLRNNSWRVKTIKFGNQPAGTHEKEFVFNLDNLPPNGGGYQWRVFIRVLGVGWPGNLELKDTEVIKVDSNYLSTDEFDISDSKIKVYPNPFENSLKVDLPANHDFNSLDIIDLHGRVIYSEDIKGLLDFNLKNADSIVKQGIYILKVSSKTSSRTLKLVKK
ncbi:T9SS type A sorting domain-containing protein [uncultured Algibacter sp.]|uniref:T9SS type A sorting domain-containing protein n=1 Tax=uncultured Algibacter sp. TaxID=298659 RepID=UPI0026306136|nr:T9SS type A sorting domain-containing protein [uncultured Algibacter sp.]